MSIRALDMNNWPYIQILNSSNKNIKLQYKYADFRYFRKIFCFSKCENV